MSEDEMVIVALVVIAGIMFARKSGGSTGVSTITSSGGPLLPCCDMHGNVVDAGGSMYCPPGTAVNQC